MFLLLHETGCVWLYFTYISCDSIQHNGNVAPECWISVNLSYIVDWAGPIVWTWCVEVWSTGKIGFGRPTCFQWLYCLSYRSVILGRQCQVLCRRADVHLRNKTISKSKKFFLNTCWFSKNDLATKWSKKYWNVDYARLLSANIEVILESRLNNCHSFRAVTKVLFCAWATSIFPPPSTHTIRFLHCCIILFTRNSHNIYIII